MTSYFNVCFQGTTETMTQKDAAMFPIIASGALFSLYLVFQVSGAELANADRQVWYGIISELSTDLMVYTSNI